MSALETSGAAPVKPRDVPWAAQLARLTATVQARKRLTPAELQAEHNRLAWVIGVHGPYVYGRQLAAVQRMMDRPHAAESGYL